MAKEIKRLRIVFMGTPSLAAAALSGLHRAGYELPLVVTQPDKPKGRGQKEAFSPVKAFAVENGLPFIQPANLKEEDALARIGGASPHAVVVAAYGKLLPPAVLCAAPLGCINIHASLLPAYRGAAPIQWALLDGAKETGVTIMKMDEGIDTGPVLLREVLPIPEDMDYGGLYEALSALGARLLLEALPLWAEGRLTPQAQPQEGASYAARLTRRDEIIDWTQPAGAIRNRIRAFCPAPGASTHIGDKEIKIMDARALTDEEAGGLLANPVLPAPPGRILGMARGSGLVAAAGEGCLLVTQVKPAGKKTMDASSWINGVRLESGQCFA